MEGCCVVDLRRELKGLTSGVMWVKKGSIWVRLGMKY